MTAHLRDSWGLESSAKTYDVLVYHELLPSRPAPQKRGASKLWTGFSGRLRQ